MAGLTKKKAAGLKWHYDFRLVERLPDTKVIRTSFLVNTIAIALLVASFGVFFYREVSAFALKSQLSSASAERESRMQQNNVLLSSINKFKEHSDRVDDLKRFFEAPFDPIQMVCDVAAVRDEEVSFDSFSYSNHWVTSDRYQVFEIRIDGKGKTTQDIDRLKDHLKAIPVAEGYLVEIHEEGNPIKDARSGYFSFRIRVSVRRK